MWNNVYHSLVLNIKSNFRLEEIISFYIEVLPYILILHLILLFVYWQKGIKRNLLDILKVQLFCFSCITILCIAEVPDIKYIMNNPPNYGPGKLYLEPARMFKYDTMGYFLNIVFFVPFGVTLALINKRSRGYFYGLIFGLLFSVLVEFLQLFNMRTTDLCDVITNTIGAFVGYTAARPFGKTIKRSKRSFRGFMIGIKAETFFAITLLLWLGLSLV